MTNQDKIYDLITDLELEQMTLDDAIAKLRETVEKAKREDEQ